MTTRLRTWLARPGFGGGARAATLREASLLVAPDAHARKNATVRLLGRGSLSVASSVLLQNVVVTCKTWRMGACVVAAAALLSRTSEAGHRLLPSRPELFTGAEDAIDKKDA